MAYNGISPYLYKNAVTAVDIFDDISGSFNGVTTTFNITVGGASYTRLTAKACLIILGGIVQEANVDYTISTGQITFTTAPVAGLTFEGRHLYGISSLDTPTAGSVAPASLSTGGPSWDTSGNLTLTGQLRGPSNFIIDPSVVGDDTGTVEIKGNLTVQGTTTTINSTTLTIDDKNIVVADGVSTLANLDTAGIDFGSTAVKLRYNYNGGTNSGLSIEGTNVGIGTTNPVAKLDVRGNILVKNLGNVTGNSSIMIGSSVTDGDLSTTGVSIRTFVESSGSNGYALQLFTQQSFLTGQTEKIRITGSGNVGIGTTNPQNPLHISGSPGTLLRIDGGDGGTGTRDIVITEFNTTDYGGIIRYDSIADLFTIGTIENSVVKNALNVSRTSGHITTPLQPAFFAVSNQGTHTTNVSAVLDFANTQINVGNYYNNGSYRFTAPIAGIYYFHSTIYTQQSGIQGSVCWRKNGVQYSIGNDAIFHKAGDITTDHTIGSSIMLNLVANDYVDLVVRAGTPGLQWFGQHSWFMGYLIG